MWFVLGFEARCGQMERACNRMHRPQTADRLVLNELPPDIEDMAILRMDIGSAKRLRFGSSKVLL